MTHFVSYLKKEKRYDIETLSVDRVLNTEHFYREIMRKIYAPEAIPGPLFNFGK